MSRQLDSCWKCGAQWAAEEAPPARLRAIDGGRAKPPGPEHVDRWIDDGGSRTAPRRGQAASTAAATSAYSAKNSSQTRM